VIEDNFARGRPRWELAGAQLVGDVQPYELIKMRLLNAAQSAFAYYGALCGHTFTFESARDPVLQQVVRNMLDRESAQTIPVAPGMEPSSYIGRVFERVTNPAIRHTNHQVATDGSQKIVQRLLNPIRERMRQGREFTGLATAVAGWIAYLVATSPRFRQRWSAADPWAKEIAGFANEGLPVTEIVRRVVAIEPIFGADLRESGFSDVVASHVTGLLSASPRDYLAQSGLLERERLA
jgi:fructuronate reductase